MRYFFYKEEQVPTLEEFLEQVEVMYTAFCSGFSTRLCYQRWRHQFRYRYQTSGRRAAHLWRNDRESTPG